MIRITDTVKHLVIINVLFFVAKLILAQRGINLDDMFSLHFPKSHLFQPWQLITHIFMHGSINHILFNMLALWMFGSALEQMWGVKKFLLFYFSAGIGAALFSLGIDYIDYYQNIAPLLDQLNFSEEVLLKIKEINCIGDKFRFDPEVLRVKLNGMLSFQEINLINKTNSFGVLFQYNIACNVTMLGASGAIMGVLVAFGMLFPNAELMLIFLPIPVKAKYFIPVIIALDIFSGLTGVSVFSPGNTAYWAHIGGALTGLLMMLYWKKTQFNKNRWN